MTVNENNFISNCYDCFLLVFIKFWHCSENPLKQGDLPKMALKGNCANLSDGDVGGRVREPENGPFKFSTFSKHCHLLPWQTYHVTIFLMKKIMLQSYTWYRTQTGCFIFCKTSKRCIQQHSM